MNTTSIKVDQLLHGEEAFFWVDAGFSVVEKKTELKKRQADRHITEQPGWLRVLEKHPLIKKVRSQTEHLKVGIPAKVEHPLRIIKCQFGFVKARYRALKTYDGKLAMLFVLAQRCVRESDVEGTCTA